jgi:hypothetical protein
MPRLPSRLIAVKHEVQREPPAAFPGLAFGPADVQKTARRAAPMSAARPGDNQGISLKRMPLDD